MKKDYFFINSKIKARLSLMLPPSFFEEAKKFKTLPELMMFFSQTSYSFVFETYQNTGDIKLIEKQLLEKEIDAFTAIRPYLAPPALDISLSLFLFYEIESIKNSLRLWFAHSKRGLSINHLSPYFLPVHINYNLSYNTLINGDSYDIFLSVFDKTPIKKIVKACISRDFYESPLTDQSLFYVEWALDLFYYESLVKSLKRVKGKDQKQLKCLIEKMVDRQNIYNLILLKKRNFLPQERGESFFIEGGYFVKQKEFKELYIMDEKNFYDSLSLWGDEYIKKRQIVHVIEGFEEDFNQLAGHFLSTEPFHIGVVLSWYIKSHKEVKRVRSLINQKYYDTLGHG